MRKRGKFRGRRMSFPPPDVVYNKSQRTQVKTYPHLACHIGISMQKYVDLDLSENRSFMMRMILAPAADRNKGVILEVLLRYLPETWSGQVLEIASGTGQHIAHFSPVLKNATFQPTDVDKNLLESISAHISRFKLQNVRPPVYVDITTAPDTWQGAEFSDGFYDVIYNSNMVHISPWQTSIGIFRAAGRLLKPQGYLFMYGPFANDGVLEPESNVNFDATLKASDPSYGIRDICDLKKLAEDNNITLVEMIDMPSNNKTLVWQKKS